MIYIFFEVVTKRLGNYIRFNMLFCHLYLLKE